jgi:hypothetical protein
MVEHPSMKQKVMYVIGTHYPLKFLNSGRALNSVMSRNRKLWDGFVARYGDTLSTVADYYLLKKADFSLVDVSSFVPGLVRSDDTLASDVDVPADR